MTVPYEGVQEASLDLTAVPDRVELREEHAVAYHGSVRPEDLREGSGEGCVFSCEADEGRLLSVKTCYRQGGCD